MSDKDIQLELKKRARRRLVGAAALAAAAAVLLPMVMDQEPRTQVQDIQVRIPNPESTDASAALAKKPVASLRSEAGESSTPPVPAVESGPAAGASKAPGSPAANDQNGAAIPRATPGHANSSEVPPKSEIAGAPGAPSGQTADKHVDKPVERRVEKASDRPSDKTAAKSEAAKSSDKPPPPPDAVSNPKTDGRSGKTEEARAQAILEGSTQQFVVQLAVFSDMDNAKKLRERVKAEGYNSFTESLQTSGGTKVRVRVGPFSSRDAAEKARDKLKALAPNGMVMPTS